MQTNHTCVLILIWTKGEVGALWNRFKPSSKIFNWPRKAARLLWIIYVISVWFLLCFRARLFIYAMSSPTGKGLASWLSFVMSNCIVVTFPLVSWVRCGAQLYRFLIFAPFLTLLCLFVWFDSLRPINNLSVIKGRVFLGWTSTKLGLMFLFKDTMQWRQWGSNRGPSVSSQALYHWATAPLLTLISCDKAC